MARARRTVRRDRLDASPWELRWARGEPLGGDAAGLVFFLSDARARALIEAVHHVSFAEWIRPRVTGLGQILYNDAIVGFLDAERFALLKAGGDPWAGLEDDES